MKPNSLFDMNCRVVDGFTVNYIIKYISVYRQKFMQKHLKLENCSSLRTSQTSMSKEMNSYFQ